MSPFKKGESGNLLGRPTGSKNKVSEEIRSTIETFISSKMSEIQTLWDKLEPKEQALFLAKILDFSIPKLKATESEVKLNVDSIRQEIVVTSEIAKKEVEKLIKKFEDE